MIWALLVGLVVGAVAKFLMPGKDPSGIFLTMVIGVIGSLIAYGTGRAMGFYLPNEPVGFIAAVVGAMLFLGILRLVKAK